MTGEPTHPIPLMVRCKLSIVRSALWLTMKTCSLNGLYILCKTFATCEWLINFKRRRRFIDRMRTIMGEHFDLAQARQACRRYFIRSRCDKIFYLVFDLIPRQEILARIQFPNRQTLEEALERQQGVYVALSHVGAQHVAGMLMCLLGYKTAGVRDRHEGAAKRYMQNRYAERFSEFKATKIFFADSFPRDLYRWFKGNGILGSALDTDRLQTEHLKRADVNIFGEQRQYLTGTMQIALRCGAAVHQGFIISRPFFNYELDLGPALVQADGANDEQRLMQTAMQDYADNIAAHLRRYPEHISRI